MAPSVALGILRCMSRRELRWGLGGAAVGLVAAIAVVVWTEPAAERLRADPQAAVANPNQPTATPEAALGTGLPTRAAATATEPPRPSGISPAQWDALRREMSQRPDGAAELQRLAGYLGFAHAAQQFRAQRQAGASGPALQALARQIDEALPERLRQRELSAAEASRLKAAVLEVQVADATERARQLQQWQQAQREHLSRSAPGTDAREPEFLRRQAALVAAWQAQPPAQRNPQQLQQQLDALRLASFPTPTTPSGGSR